MNHAGSNADGRVHDLPFSPAAERNQTPILESLKAILPAKSTVLEIGAGTGQHSVAFAAALPDIDWQPSDRAEAIPALESRITLFAGPGKLENLRLPLQLDVIQDRWPARTFTAIYSANTAHIMSWQGVLAMLEGVAAALEAQAPFILYGPFNQHGEYSSASNQLFDESLKARDRLMGIRDIDDLETAAKCHQLRLHDVIEMPANNRILHFISGP